MVYIENDNCLVGEKMEEGFGRFSFVLVLLGILGWRIIVSVFLVGRLVVKLREKVSYRIVFEVK